MIISSPTLYAAFDSFVFAKAFPLCHPEYSIDDQEQHDNIVAAIQMRTYDLQRAPEDDLFHTLSFLRGEYLTQHQLRYLSNLYKVNKCLQTLGCSDINEVDRCYRESLDCCKAGPLYVLPVNGSIYFTQTKFIEARLYIAYELVRRHLSRTQGLSRKDSDASISSIDVE